MNWFGENWQRVLFAIIGFVFLLFSIKYAINDKIAESSGTFAISFLSFLYSNISRFKKFKGLGFEAELWEDKQKEAAELIDRLKKIVSIFTTQTVLNSVTKNRWGGPADWKSNWKLYDDLVDQHKVLGHKIDFSDLKKQVDDYFLFDLCMHNSSIRKRITAARSTARKMIEDEFGDPVSDQVGHVKRHAQLREIIEKFDDPFKVSTRANLAREMLQWAEKAKTAAKEHFGINIEFDRSEMEKLEKLSKLYENRPVEVTEELIEMSKLGNDE